MEYIFYNKNTPIFSFNMVGSHIVRINEVFNPEYRPFQVEYNEKNNKIIKSSFEKFLKGRRIPDTRQEKEEILNNIDNRNLFDLSLSYYGLSLSDQYWMKKNNDDIKWKDINFFQNDFSKDMGAFIFGDDIDSFSLKTPNNTSDGWLKKAWVIENGKRVLVKGSSAPYFQESFNEKIAYKISKSLGINHIKYDVVKINDNYCSICDNFIDENTELVPANAIINSIKKSSNISMYDFLVDELIKLGIKDAKNKIDEMLFLDYIIYNEDRHFNNFGFIRNVETLKVIGMSPIYDSGTSLFYNTLDSAIPFANPGVKPFYSKREKQFNLIKNMDFEVDKDIVYKIIVDTLSESDYLEKFSKDRKNIIAEKIIKNSLFVK